MKTLGSAASVAAAIRDEAAQRVEEIDRRAKEAVQMLASAAGEIGDDTVERTTQLAGANRLARERLARDEWNDQRTGLEAREQWIQGVRDEGMRRLSILDDEARREDLARMAQDALLRIPALDCEVLLNDADRRLVGISWIDEMSRITGKNTVRVAATDRPMTGGCIVRSADGKMSFDNSFEARAQRLESVWRAALGQLYEKAVASLEKSE